MIFEKMKQLGCVYNSFSTDTSAFAYIKENIHAEKYINDETIQKCIDVQSRGKRLALGKFVDEDRIIACLVIDHYLSLNICTTWYDAARSWKYSNYLYQLLINVLTAYYTSTIIKYLDDIVDYQKELDKYDPEIFHKGDKYLVKVNYRTYGIHFNSIIGVDKLTKENLKKVKLAIDDAEIFLLNLKAFRGEIESFISNVMRFLGDDYEVKISDDNYTITLKEDAERRYAVDKRLYFYINFRFYTNSSNSSEEKAISLGAYVIRVKVKRPGAFRSDIAVILDKIVRMENFSSIYDVNFYDLDELYDAVKRTHDSNFRHVEVILDQEVS